MLMEGNIRMYLAEVGFGRMNRIQLAEERDQWRAFENMVMNLLVP